MTKEKTTHPIEPFFIILGCLSIGMLIGVLISVVFIIMQLTITEPQERWVECLDHKMNETYIATITYEGETVGAIIICEGIDIPIIGCMPGKIIFYVNRTDEGLPNEIVVNITNDMIRKVEKHYCLVRIGD